MTKIQVQVQNCDTNEVKTFESIAKCCDYYNISSTTLNKIINNIPTLKKGSLPQNHKITKFENVQSSESFEKIDENYIKCLSCDKIIKKMSKYQHLMTQKHKHLIYPSNHSK